jgi:xRRM domain
MCRFIGSLLGESCSFLQVQNVTIPHHHLDTSDSQPKLKGFAFVTLSLQSAENILRDWPWTRRNQSSEELSVVAREGAKVGFRTISKVRWGELKDEYLAYRERLLEDIAAAEDDVTAPTRQSIVASQLEAETASSYRHTPQTHGSASYPIGCLIFVRNIHPETNKTTLRKLFTSAIGEGMGWLDYVDFNKGMDTVSFVMLNVVC